MNKEYFDKMKSDLRAAKAILAFCVRNRAEFLPRPTGVILITPRKLSEEAQVEFKGLLPGNPPVEFAEMPKLQTKMNLENILGRAKTKDAKVIPDLDHRTITIELEGIPESDGVWAELSETLKQDGYFDDWKFIVEGHEVKVIAKIAEMAKKTTRETFINDTDITDLKISLANAQSIDDILKAIGG